MKYTSHPGRYADAVEFPYYPCAAVDADDQVIDRYGIYVDTESGVVISNPRTPDGLPQVGSRWVVELVEVFKAPLTIVPCRIVDGKVVRADADTPFTTNHNTPP